MFACILYCIHIPGASKFSHVRNKSPILEDAFNLLSDCSSLWDEFARELKVVKLRDELQCKMGSNDHKLESVLKKWIQLQTSDVTWDNIIKVLISLERLDMAQKVKNHLCDKLFDKYVNEKDYSPFEYERLL